MRVVHVSSMDQSGGANRAALRLVEAQRDAGINAVLAVQEKSGNNSYVVGGTSICGIKTGRIRRFLEKQAIRLLTGNHQGPYSACILPGKGIGNKVLEGADLLHLHHIGQGTLSLSAIAAARVPVIWTLHDMWPLTGGDHYRRDDDLEGFSGNASSFDRRLWQRKASLYRKCRPLLVSPSTWLADCARRARLTRGLVVEVIPNPLHQGFFQITDRSSARRELNLPEDRPLLLLGADQSGLDDPRKGLDLLIQSLKQLTGDAAGFHLVTIGRPADRLLRGLSHPVHRLGQLRSSGALCLAYNAVDAFAAPSRQDNLPNMVVESLACGTPVCAFSIGGMTDLILHGERGFLAPPFSAGDFAKGIQTVLEMGTRPDVRDACSAFVRRHCDPSSIAARYLDLYDSLLQQEGGAAS